MTPEDLMRLHGQTVLVKSAVETARPRIARRGTIEVRTVAGELPEVAIVLEFPDMSNRAAHRRVISISDDGVNRLWASERNGAYEYTIDDPIDPCPDGSTDFTD